MTICALRKSRIYITILTVALMLFSGQLFAAKLIEKKKNKSAATVLVDVVAFSYNRPLQLFAFLESCQNHVKGIGQLHVIYRSSNEAYEDSYQEVRDYFPHVIMHKQSDEKAHDEFKDLVVNCVYKEPSSQYIMFAVDDDIFIRDVSLADCVQLLEQRKAWGFFLRLGKNFNFTYTLNSASPVPRGNNGRNYFQWQFKKGSGDWAYPNNVDLTIYRKKDIEHFLRDGIYKHPNSLERAWQHYLPSTRSLGVCYHESKGINIPLNIVNPSDNRHMGLYTPEQLLEKFEEGYKIDISQLDKQTFNSFHVGIEPSFIER